MATINLWMLGIALLYLSCPFTTNAWRPYEIKLTNFSFSSVNNNFTFNVTITNSVIDAWIDVKETIEQLYVHPEVHLDLGNGKYDFEFMNRRVDVCRLLRDKKYEPLIQMAFRSILPYCNCPSRCPISKKLYHINELRISSEYFPPSFPERKALLHLKFLRKIDQTLELLGTMSVVINVEKKYKSNG
ncbi:uncharacterized protein LOC119075911 [Bradysia coprophila]|uniref:uncharacterized protein LOC119075911 n=1 Tax=Bradysia coprophila TaxID=38358 RepID=UPI00187DD6C4|nr:uncharacterized protein LOC119075911 [Bradysia coprophila]